MLRVPRPSRTLAVALATAVMVTQGPPLIVRADGRARTSLPNDARAITHALNRLAFGPRPGEVARVEAMTLAAYIEQQLQPSTIPDAALEARLAPAVTLTMSARALAAEYFVPAQQERRERQRTSGGEAAPQAGADVSAVDPASHDARARRASMTEAQRGVVRAQDELVQQRLLRAIGSERQLQEVLVDFWFNHFNVFAGKGAVRIYLGEYERDVIRPRVLGSFRDLLGAVARSPAMLFYLDNWMSTAPGAPALRETMRRDAAARARATGAGGARRRPAREPRADEARGRTAPDGVTASPRTPRGLNENYARELLELHTLGVDGGYTQADIVAVARAFTGWTIAGPRQGGGFAFVEALHDSAPKKVLGHVIDAGGIADGERVLDIVAAHPSTARFIATKLARRFVADDPPAALVDRAARVFTETGGDLRAVTRAIVTSPEFFAPAAWRAKVRSPFEFLVSAIRMTGARTDDTLALGRALRELGQPLYQAQPPTGYGDVAATWINTGALLARMNVALALAGHRLRGVAMPPTPAATSPEITRAATLQALLAGEASDATRDAVAKGSDPARIVALTLGSPDFQRR